VRRQTAARGVAALTLVGLGVGVALAGSSFDRSTRTKAQQMGFSRLAAGGAATRAPGGAATAGVQVRHGALVTPSEFNGSIRNLPHVAPTRRTSGPETGSPALGAQKKPLPGAEAPKIVTPVVSAPAPDPLISFKGLDFLNWGAGHPPDTVGDVGPTVFVQAVNTSIGIFRKSDGAQLGAFEFDTLWALAGVTGTACDSKNRGDPTVVYDPLGDRWIVADFAFANVSSPPYYECIAVSKTSDPVSGGWWFYPIRTDDLSHPWLADYPKMGIWPDALYMTANMFQGNTFREARVWAFKRSDLESGAALHSVVVDLGAANHFSLLPSNMRTVAGAPPAGRDNILVAESGSGFAFEVWKLHPDFTGSGTTFTPSPTNVSEASYDFFAPYKVPTPGNSLDALFDRLMMQAQYTNTGGVESVWVNHTVHCCGSGSPMGIQWAQIDVTGGTVATTPVQQQIYPSTNDGLSRWMGSLAVDKNGDMALGYSVANASTNPDIRYAGRLSFDPLNALPQAETTMLSGVTRGTQTGTCNGTCERWGDYSGMTIDPTDGCTFWYTQMYYETTGLNWQTRIGSFRFPACLKSNQTISFGALANKSVGDPDFLVSASASSGLPVAFAASGNCTVAGSTVHLTGIGSCTIAASQPGNASTNPARDVSQSFAIAKGNQTISFTAPPAKTFGDADFAVGAATSSGLAVTFAASGTCTISGAVVHIVAAGTCTVTASQAGDGNYNAAANVSQTFAIAKAAQTIAFAALAKKTLGAPNFAVSAKASSDLPISFAAKGACTVSGATVHLKATGSCTITASQGGDANYNAAESVSRSFAVAPPPCKVPKVVGKTLDAAKRALKKAHCRTGKVSRAYSNTTKIGHVSSQSRRAGRVLPNNTKVSLVVSRGAKALGAHRRKPKTTLRSARVRG
jgi:hypothetical protein